MIQFKYKKLYYKIKLFNKINIKKYQKNIAVLLCDVFLISSTYTQYLPIRRRNRRRKAPTAPSVELDERYRPTVTCCCVAVTQRTVT